jgi:hypothetical protein
VHVVGQKRECEALRSALRQYPPQPLDEGIPVRIVSEDCLPFDPPNHQVVQRAWSVNASFSRHASRI